MKDVISYEFAKEIGLIKDPFESRRLASYSGQYLLEGWHQAERRREISEVGIQHDIEMAKNLPNCVDKDLMLFEFDVDDIKQASHKTILVRP